MVTVMNVPLKTKEETFKRAAGGWKRTINAKKLIKDIYEHHLLST